ncbi:MAG: patatin-like phospholipase family protein [Candidatus Zixiibacteriota bacterium]|nr:MAG: patatin-like phospholipase family protein [candidate division Zixibacteria bacterium]
MKIKDFVSDAQVVKQITRLNQKFVRKKVKVSDILDAQGHQYVDLVMEGGGVLGIALVGYTYALEKAGIRFLGVGGTSAGAINALLVAGVGRPNEAKSEKILGILAALDMFSFVDGDDDAEDFCRAMVNKAGKLRLMLKGWQVIDNLTERLGLNPGKTFLEWLTSQLKKYGVTTLAELEQQMKPPSLHTRDGDAISARKAGAKLALVAADISTETKVVFPEMAPLYWRKYKQVNPACFVRASMSIPAFFEPYRIKEIPQGLEAARLWDKHAGYDGHLPEEVVFVDGGIMSNFPITLFHSDEAPPLAPTFGVKLGVERMRPREVESFGSLLGGVFDAARHCADYDFLIQNPDYEHLVTFIRTGEHNWLDFFMKDDAKVDLFRRGVEAGVEFLLGFDWGDYKDLRVRLKNSPRS